MSAFPIDSLLDITIEAGQLVLQMQADGLQNIRNKSTATDLVTEADLACERFLRSALGKLLPDADLWGEESNRLPQSSHFWIVDPIDGTTNFANGIPYFAISIALSHRNNTAENNDSTQVATELVATEFIETDLAVVVELPALRVRWAKKGEGAFLRTATGDQPIQVNQVTELNQAVIGTGFPYHAATSSDRNGLEFTHFIPRCQGMRALGAAALDLSFVAQGVLTGFWEGWLEPWDIAAGALLIREAGGTVTDYNGDPWALKLHKDASRSGNIHIIKPRGTVASNGQPNIHQSLVEGIRSVRRGLSENLLEDRHVDACGFQR